MKPGVMTPVFGAVTDTLFHYTLQIKLAYVWELLSHRAALNTEKRDNQVKCQSCEKAVYASVVLISTPWRRTPTNTLSLTEMKCCNFLVGWENKVSLPTSAMRSCRNENRLHGFPTAPLLQSDQRADDSFPQSLGLLPSLCGGSMGLALFFSILMG